MAACVLSLFGLTALTPETATAETRTLTLYNNHTYERATITFKRNGRYLPQGIKELNRFLRDWRRNESIKMDPQLFDLIWEVYQKSGSRRPIHVVSGYRSPATNNMLRRRSRGVARFSQHTQGRAMDFFLPDVPISKLRAIGLRKGFGGVGYYPSSRSPFVHMDTGRVRHWPRMSRKQLVRVFPNGGTLHVPRDGRPLPGYKSALAAYKRRKRGRTTVLASAPTNRRTTARGGRGETVATDRTSTGARSSAVFASLFNREGSSSSKTRSGPRPPKSISGDSRRRVASLSSGSEGSLPGVTTGKPVALAEDTRRKRPAGWVPKPLRKPSVMLASRETGGSETGSLYGAKGRKIDKSLLSGSRLAYSSPTDDGSSTITGSLSGTEDAKRRARGKFLLAALPSGDSTSRAMRDHAKRMAAAAPAIPLAQAPGMGMSAMTFGGNSLLLDGSTTTRRKAFGVLYKPNPTGLNALLVKPSKAVNIQFGRPTLRTLRTDRFTGPTVVAINQIAFQ